MSNDSGDHLNRCHWPNIGAHSSQWWVQNITWEVVSKERNNQILIKPLRCNCRIYRTQGEEPAEQCHRKGSAKFSPGDSTGQTATQPHSLRKTVNYEREKAGQGYTKGRPTDRKKPRLWGGGKIPFNFPQSGYQGFLSVGCLRWKQWKWEMAKCTFYWQLAHFSLDICASLPLLHELPDGGYCGARSQVMSYGPSSFSTICSAETE